MFLLLPVIALRLENVQVSAEVNEPGFNVFLLADSDKIARRFLWRLLKRWNRADHNCPENHRCVPELSCRVCTLSRRAESQRCEAFFVVFSAIPSMCLLPWQGEKVADRPDEGFFAVSVVWKSLTALDSGLQHQRLVA